jgi:hypothetical protein
MLFLENFLHNKRDTMYSLNVTFQNSNTHNNFPLDKKFVSTYVFIKANNILLMNCINILFTIS